MNYVILLKEGKIDFVDSAGWTGKDRLRGFRILEQEMNYFSNRGESMNTIKTTFKVWLVGMAEKPYSVEADVIEGEVWSRDCPAGLLIVQRVNADDGVEPGHRFLMGYEPVPNPQNVEPQIVFVEVTETMVHSVPADDAHRKWWDEVLASIAAAAAETVPTEAPSGTDDTLPPSAGDPPRDSFHGAPDSKPSESAP